MERFGGVKKELKMMFGILSVTKKNAKLLSSSNQW
jgi:hypothetical protein